MAIHPNVVLFYGAYFPEKWTKNKIYRNPILVMEYFEYGDLRSFLKNNSPQTKRLTIKSCLNIAYDISKGVKFLHVNGIIHRDIAARNCLISKNLTGKIADFGLCISGKDYVYYGVKATAAYNKEQLPQKWLPIETLEGVIVFTHFADSYKGGHGSCGKSFSSGFYVAAIAADVM